MARNTGKQALVTGGAGLIGSHIVDLMLREGWSVRISPAVKGEFRPGEMRHLTSDITRAQHMGYAPQVDLLTGIARCVEWIQSAGQGSRLLRRSGTPAARKADRSSGCCAGICTWFAARGTLSR